MMQACITTNCYKETSWKYEGNIKCPKADTGLRLKSFRYNLRI